jgi:CRP-like cAMP-binding protein
MSVIMSMFEGSQGERHEPGATIFSRGEPGKAMYVILEGQVELRIADGVIEVLGPGEPFGEMALVDSEPRVATAVARTACRLARVPEERFLALIQDKPYFGLEIMKVMANRLRRMNAAAS